MNVVKMMDAVTYQDQAQVTLSHSFFGEYFPIAEFVSALNDAIVAAAKLDVIKKGLFYGRNISEREVVKTESLGNLNLTGAEEVILHGLLGGVTEAGESAEILRDFIAGFLTAKTREERPQLDYQHIIEESGDQLWYQAITAEAMDTFIGEAMAINIAKLRKRYGDKFDAYEANNRNLAAERQAMTGEVTTMVDVAAPKIGPTADDEVERFVSNDPYIQQGGESDDDYARRLVAGMNFAL